MKATGPQEDDVLESRDFYEMCQQYRHAHEGHPHIGLTPQATFQALKDWIRAHCIVSTDPTVDDKWNS